MSQQSLSHREFVARFLVQEAFEMFASEEVETSLIAILAVIDDVNAARKRRMVKVFLQVLADSFIKGESNFSGVKANSEQYNLLANVTVSSPLGLLLKGFLLSPTGDVSGCISILRKKKYPETAISKLNDLKGKPWDERTESERTLRVAQFIYILIDLLELSCTI